MSNRIRLVFGAVLLSQVLQYPVVARFKEPYPSLMMPQFSGTLTDRDGNIRLKTVACKVLFRDDTIAWLSPNSLLSRAPGSHSDAIMNHMFGLRDSEPAPPQPAGKGRKLKAYLFPALMTSDAISAQKQLDTETRQWLEQRLVEIYPSEKAVAVAFIWHNDVYRMDGANKTLSKVREEPLGAFEVRLDEPR